MSHEQNRGLLDALTKCAEECNHCAAACLEEQDVKMLARCIKLDIDCAEICSLAASFVARGSEHAQHLLHECAASAKPVLKNAKSMQAWEWSIAEGVQKLAGLVPKPAIQEWQRKSNKDAEYSASFLSLSNILSNHKN
jgi:Domain of Unknown Function (DUF326)